MHRIDTINARPNGNGSGKSGYHLNDDLPGVDPTNLDADALNAFQEEIATVIESTGSALEKGTNNQLLAAIKKIAFEASWPIGSVYENAVDGRNPSHADLLGFGTWVVYATGRVTVGLDESQTEFDEIGKTGGLKKVELAENEIPDHTHYRNSDETSEQVLNGSGSNGTVNDGSSGDDPFTETGGMVGGFGQAHENLQPYVVSAQWRRTA